MVSGELAKFKKFFELIKLLLVLTYFKLESIFESVINYECTALSNWVTGHKLRQIIIPFFKLSIEDNLIMVGRVGYAPTTPAMSMQYSTIELTAQINY
mgnify:CR=1 FL=1